ncbi:MAG: polyprenyl synthetase family protein [bacterium]|nr:polyprenyl synthetase family protein [bacterium]
MSNIQDELKNVSVLINDIIVNDNYCNNIEPEHLQNAVKLYPLRAGKRLRPAIVLWCCGLLNGNVEKAKYAAAAVEVYHNWTLVHDDIIDGDELRRGMPATHTEIKNFAQDNYHISLNECDKFGIDFGILTGDLQQAWAISLLIKSTQIGVSGDVVLSLCSDMVNKLAVELISGEALDVDFSYRNIKNINSNEVEKMLFLKTSALLNYSASCGARIALNTPNAEKEEIKRIIEFTSSLGIAFQLRDDWLGIYGDEKKLGKPVGSDICAAKPTLLILETLKNVDDLGKQYLFNLMGKKEINEDELNNVRDYVTSSGAEKTILTKLNNMKLNADNAIACFSDNKYKKLLIELNDYLLKRDI